VTEALPFTRDDYAGRLEAFREALGTRGLQTAIVTNPSNICYLTGYGHKGAGVRALVVTPGRDPALVVSDIEVGNAEFILGRSPVASYKTYLSYGVGSPARTVVEVLGATSGKSLEIGVEPQAWPASEFDELRAALPDAKFPSIGGVVNRQRLVKSPTELDYIRRAASIADLAATATLAEMRPGVSEGHLAGVAMATMNDNGGEYQAGWPNVKVGPTSGIVHTGWTSRTIAPGDHVYVELAGSINYYHAVLWRTGFVGKPDDERRRCSDAIARASDAALAAVRPGAIAGDIHGIQKRILDEAGFGEHMLKLAGYSVGLALPPSWMEGTTIGPGSDLVLQPRMVFHMGAYVLIPGKWAIAASQTIAVTETGFESLTKTEKGPLFLQEERA
jgi:Xaa-Pro dipeptidase